MPAIQGTIALWAQRTLHFDRAQQGDLSVFQEVSLLPTAPNVAKVFIVEKVLSTKSHAHRERMVMNTGCQQRSAPAIVQQLSQQSMG